MKDKVLDWLEAGIELFAETKTLEMNSLCKKIGRTKSSFYHIWPNLNDSRGYDRFIKDLIEHHERVIQAHYESLRKAFLITDFPEIIEVLVEKSEKVFVYQKFSAQLRLLKNKSPFLEKYSEKSITNAVNLINDFWKAYNFKEDEILNNHELRLIIDSHLQLTYDEWIKDLRNIFDKGWQSRNPKKDMK